MDGKAKFIFPILATDIIVSVGSYYMRRRATVGIVALIERA
jgi:hypothetical protein